MFDSDRSVGTIFTLVVAVLLTLSTVGVGSAALEPSSVASADTTDNISIEISDSSNGNDTAYAEIVVSTSDLSQQDRVLQITGKETVSQLTVGDISNVITLYNRNQSNNGIAIELDDISNTITLYNRNR